MQEFGDITIGLLRSFTSDRHRTAAMMWIGLLLVSRLKYRSENQPHESLLVWGYGFGLTRELLMLAASVFSDNDVMPLGQLHLFIPPLEHALAGLAAIAISAGYMLYVAGSQKIVSRYLNAGKLSVAAIFLATFFWWWQYARSNPGASFGETWCDWAFRINACLWLGAGLVCLWVNSKGWIRHAICLAIGLIFLDNFLRLPDMATGEAYRDVFDPIRHSLSLVSIPVLGYVYLRCHADELLAAFESLEDMVAARTTDLENAMEELSVANEQLLRVSRIDPLTKLYNRRAFGHEYEKLHSHVCFENQPIAVMLIDLDHFKNINDTFGHQVGDNCLEAVGAILLEQFGRRNDLAARYGGEEFIVVVANTHWDEVTEQAEKLRVRLAENQIITPAGPLSFTASIGVAYSTQECQDYRTSLIQLADESLYKAKRQGRNRVVSVNRSGAGADANGDRSKSRSSHQTAMNVIASWPEATE